MRKLLFVLLAVVVLAALGAAGVWFLHQRSLDAREARIAELETRLDDLRAAGRLDPQQACLIAEHHLLLRPISRALRVTCDAPGLDDTAPGVVKLSGLLRAGNMEDALFGGGFGETLCLARAVDGWVVVGDAHKMNDCRFTPPPDTPADRMAAAVTAALTVERRAEAEQAIALVRGALADTGAAPESCTGLEAASVHQLGLIDTDILGEAPTEQQLIGWGDLTSLAVKACLGVDPQSLAQPHSCRLGQPWRYALVFDRPEKQMPVKLSDDRFSGGVFRATLRLVDMQAGRVICARPMTYQLPDEVLETKHVKIQNIYYDGVREAICREIETLGQGMLSVPYGWCG